MMWFPVTTSVQGSNADKFKIVHRVQFLNLAASQIKFVRHFESITKNTWCKVKLLDIFCGITAGFAYRRTSEFAFKNARRV